MFHTYLCIYHFQFNSVESIGQGTVLDHLATAPNSLTAEFSQDHSSMLGERIVSAFADSKDAVR